MTVLVAGAGIGGLATALSLEAAGHTDVVVVEAAADLQPLGVGLNILPNAVRELTDLGLLDEIASCAIPTRELALHNRYGRLIWSESRGRTAGYRWPQFSLQRSHLQHVLLDATRRRLGPDVVRTGTRVVTFENRPDGAVRVVLRDGQGVESTIAADVLVGADGVHSAVRAAMYPDEGPPPWNGWVMYRGIAWGPPFLTGATMAVIGDDGHRMVFYPVAPDPHGKDRVLINWVAGRPADGETWHGDWRRTGTRQEVLEHFGDWRVDWLDIPQVVGEALAVYVYPMIDREPLPRWTSGRATLLGDAAHAMYPMGSNGATQAIVDARVLAHSLALHDDVDEALARYEDARRPAMTELQLSNRRHGPEAVISLVHQRAPEGFTDLHDVISEAELEEISARYATIAGFDVDTVNRRPSLTVPTKERGR